LSFPSAIQSNSCAECARSSSGVWIWSKNTAFDQADWREAWMLFPGDVA
jgi:uncharacterized membrane protein YfcA